MINIISYGSGSKGNLYYLTSNNAKIILECGIETSEIENMLHANNIIATDVNACITSHCHTDHSCNIAYFQEYGVPCFCTKETIDRYKMLNYQYNMPHILQNYKMFKIKDLIFLPFNVNHGNVECFGFVIKDTIDNDCILFITDFIEVKCNFKSYKFNKIYIECNYVDDNLTKAIEEDKTINNLNMTIKHKRQLNTHMSLQNLITTLKNIDLSECDVLALIHVSEELGDRRLMMKTIIEEYGVNCVALSKKGEVIEYYGKRI